MGLPSKLATATLGRALICLALALGMSACSSGSNITDVTDVTETNDLGNHFETSNSQDEILDDGSGNELAVGSDLFLPTTWPEGVPTPTGTLIAVSVIDDRTAVATWSVQGDVFQVQQMFLPAFDSGFVVEPIPDLSTDTIVVYGAVGNGYDITVSATLGEKATDPGEITMLVNPSI
jgi:hypothetical protein